MGREGLLIGEVAGRSGVSRKAVRLYEAAGILPTPRRTIAGYRVYGSETLAVLTFVAQARRLGFGLVDIQEIVALRRSGVAPCEHVRKLALRKLRDVERTLADLAAVRTRLRELLSARRRRRSSQATVCPHIEQLVAWRRRRAT